MRNEILRRRVRTPAADAGGGAARRARMNHAWISARTRPSSSPPTRWRRVVVALIVWVVLDYRRQQRALRRARSRGRHAALRPGSSGHDMSVADDRRRNRAAVWLVAAAAVSFSRRWPRCSCSGSAPAIPSRLPSALIGRPAPATALPPLDGLTANGAAVPGLDLPTSRARSRSSMSGRHGACPATTRRRC